ncbi:MAG: hypothetical protein ACREQQ_16555, partial [Candidatus Binatia bacterium]
LENILGREGGTASVDDAARRLDVAARLGAPGALVITEREVVVELPVDVEASGSAPDRFVRTAKNLSADPGPTSPKHGAAIDRGRGLTPRRPADTPKA